MHILSLLVRESYNKKMRNRGRHHHHQQQQQQHARCCTFSQLFISWTMAVAVASLLSLSPNVHSWTIHPRSSIITIGSSHISARRLDSNNNNNNFFWTNSKVAAGTKSRIIDSSLLLTAKKRNRSGSSATSKEDKDRWYEDIDVNKSPDDVFWEEMERQRILESGGGGSGGMMTESSSSNGTPIQTSALLTSSLSSFANTAAASASISSRGGPIPFASAGSSSMPFVSSMSSMGGGGGSSSSSFSSSSYGDNMGMGGGQNNPSTQSSASYIQQQKMQQQRTVQLFNSNFKSIMAALSEYEAYMCPDNWLDDDLIEFMISNDANLFDDDKFNEGVPSLDEQLTAWKEEDDDDEKNKNEKKTNGDSSTNGSEEDDDYEYYYEDVEEEDDDDTASSNAWMQSDEPWDHWGETPIAATNKNGASYDPDFDDRVKMDPEKVKSGPASQFLFHNDDDEGYDDEDEELAIQKEEQEYTERLSKISVFSERLQRAKDSVKAKAFFGRTPNAMEGFDRLWVSAIDDVCFKNLVGTFQNYGIEFADNFGDWEDGSSEDGLLYTIEEIASAKARQVYNVTGLPCIASRTSWEIEPVPDWNQIIKNHRVVSGYRFNDVGMHVDYICEALRDISEPDRVTRFKTCLCFYDGEMEIFDYGTCDVDIYFSNSLRTFIPVAQAINEMMKTLELTFGLEYQKWLRTRIDEASMAGGAARGPDGELLYTSGAASMKLRDRVLKEGKVLPNDIIDVSAFMDSMVDVNLMDECSSELASRFFNEKPTKILTVATTGLVIALPMAKYLQVPVVYARKERNVVMADTYIAGYSSKTVGKNRELLVAKSHLHEDDRVLIVDDFLSSGASQEALLRIVSESGATSVGVGVLLEKVYDSGRQSLSGFDIPIHSLCRIASVKGGVIQLVEEEGFDRMSIMELRQSETTS